MLQNINIENAPTSPELDVIVAIAILSYNLHWENCENLLLKNYLIITVAN